MTIRRSRSFYFDSHRKRNSSLGRVAEEIGDGDEATALMKSPKLPRSCAMACIASFFSDTTGSPNSSPSSSPEKTPTKLLVKVAPDSQPPPVPAKLSKYVDQGVPKRKPPPPPPPPHEHRQPRSSSAPRPENTPSRLHKAESPSRSQLRANANAVDEPQRRERSSSLAPPVSQNDGQRRVASSPTTSRPTSYHSDQEGNKKLNKRKSWLGMSRSRNTSQDLDPAHLASAWVVMGGQKMDYMLSMLTDGLKIGELFPDGKQASADTFVYLFPQESGRQAQFKIHSPVIASSSILHALSIADDSSSISSSSRQRARSFDGRQNLAIEDAMRNLTFNAPQPASQHRNFPIDNQSTSDGSNESIRSLEERPRQFHLYFPTNLSSDGPEFSARDIQRLVDVRNLFALLEGQALVMTKACPTQFHVLMTIASLLQEFDFTNSDGSTYGEAFTSAFDFYSDNEKLGNVSCSREKTIEGIILGERMRSLELYNEAFAHAVGKYEAVKAVNPSLYSQISHNTRKRLDRAFLDLGQRQRAAEIRLAEFEFPSLFAGIAASNSSEESKFVRFKAWKSHFLSLRKFVLSYYKDLHGQWPPKASSKKNSFTEGGLNRLVLKGLYYDLCGLYDLLADREAITTRGINASEDKDTTHVDPTAAALRRLLAEFDRSSPPVSPPIPFDIPLIPTMATLNPNFYAQGPKEQNMLANKKLKDHENQLLIAKSHNQYVDPTNQDAGFKKTPFLGAFEAFEFKEARSKTCAQLADMRYGHWIFMYAVLQSLPRLVVDAPRLRYTEGVEYFLCEPPMGNPPWMEDSGVKREWYGVAGSGNAVVLPSDLVVHGVEGIYDRSYCWVQARKWIGPDVPHSTHQEIHEVDRTAALSPLQPPPGFAGGELGARSLSREGRNSITSEGFGSENRGRSRQSQRNSIAIGLERLPIPIAPGSASPSLQGTGSRAQSPAAMSLDSQGRRVSSSGLLGGSDANSGTTFDDILGSMTSQQPKEGGRGSGLMGRFK